MNTAAFSPAQGNYFVGTCLFQKKKIEDMGT